MRGIRREKDARYPALTIWLMLPEKDDANAVLDLKARPPKYARGGRTEWRQWPRDAALPSVSVSVSDQDEELKKWAKDSGWCGFRERCEAACIAITVWRHHSEKGSTTLPAALYHNDLPQVLMVVSENTAFPYGYRTLETLVNGPQTAYMIDRSIWVPNLHIIEPTEGLDRLLKKCIVPWCTTSLIPAIRDLQWSFTNGYPMVALTVPAYRSMDKIERCLDSFRQQNWPNIRLIVLNENDAGDEWTKDLWLRLYGQLPPWCARVNTSGELDDDEPDQDHRIRLVQLDHHSGHIGRAKKMCSGIASDSEVLIEFDHDDYLLPWATRRIVQAFVDHPECAFAFAESSEVYWNPPTYDVSCYGDRFATGDGLAWYVHVHEWLNRDEIVLATAPVNLRNLRHLITLPNHPRCWRTQFYFAIGGNPVQLLGADDHATMLESFLATRFLRIPVLLYLQFRNAGGDNFTNHYFDPIQIWCQRNIECFRPYLLERVHQAGWVGADADGKLSLSPWNKDVQYDDFTAEELTYRQAIIDKEEREKPWERDRCWLSDSNLSFDFYRRPDDHPSNQGTESVSWEKNATTRIWILNRMMPDMTNERYAQHYRECIRDVLGQPFDGTVHFVIVGHVLNVEELKRLARLFPTGTFMWRPMRGELMTTSYRMIRWAKRMRATKEYTVLGTVGPHDLDWAEHGCYLPKPAQAGVLHEKNAERLERLFRSKATAVEVNNVVPSKRYPSGSLIDSEPQWLYAQSA